MTTNTAEQEPAKTRRRAWLMPDDLLSTAWHGSNAQQARAWSQLISTTVSPKDGQIEKVQRVLQSLKDTKKLTPDASKCVPQPAVGVSERRQLTVRLVPTTTMRALQDLHARHPNDKLAVLNNANDRVPGGGFLNGSTAQEESLCLYTNLLLSLKKTFYPIRPHELIYSPDVLVMKHDNGKVWNGPLLDPSEEYWVDVISAAALVTPPLKPDPNHINTTMYNVDGTLAARKMTWATDADRATMHTGITKIVEAAAVNHVQRLVLGAWGCGAFRNPVHAVAAHFLDVLLGPDTPAPDNLPPFHWPGLGLEEVVFAVYDTDQKNGQPVFSGFINEFGVQPDLPEGMEIISREEVCHHVFWPETPDLPEAAESWLSIPGLLTAAKMEPLTE